MVTADNITDAQIRELRREQPELLDTLMIAIHSEDLALRKAARARFVEIFNARAQAATSTLRA
jgi:hypothetical protein